MFEINPIDLSYPPSGTPSEDELEYGIYPVDFVLETVVQAGLKWFRDTPEAPNLVYGHLRAPWLSVRYGQKKIDEIAAFIRKYDIKLIQHWSLIDLHVPSISFQLLHGGEMPERAGLADHEGEMDVLDADENVVSRKGVGYSPITDNMQIGIHSSNTPDMVKYLYMLVIYILNAFKPQLEGRGLMLGTFQATDISRLNEFLPENVYSRFINFSAFTTARFDKGSVPMIEEIIGVHIADPVSESAPSIEDGITISLEGEL